MDSAVTSGDPIATFTHDAGGAATLFAYQPEPALVTRQGEQMANRLYGIIDTRSPKTPYICVWRDPDPTRFRANADAGPPHQILLGCGFGTGPWHPPADLAQNAAEAMQRDEARVTMGWDRNDGQYRLTRFEVSVTNFAAGRDFRSVWFDDEIEQLKFDRCEIGFPASPIDAMSFVVTGALPRRYNRHEAPRDPITAFTATGTAPPIPEWVLY